MLLKFVPANSTIYGKVLSCRLNNTYEALASLNRKSPAGLKSTMWCASYTSTLTSAATELEHDVLLQELADSLHLNGQLLDV